ncbi:MAG TPA: sulfite exporter TauE/SafE family protein [Rhodocyclaceae bacterium]|nr:sulfite exporter TauE/SafE family protein [Rhodocyclaceae bacterium]
MTLSLWWLGYPLIGALAGFLAGLFGVGGGLAIVPLLYLLFSAQDFAHAHLMHVALGTAAASIVFTSITSMREHHRLGNIDWGIVRAMAPGLVLGAVVGSGFASRLPTRPLVLIFTAIVLYAAGQMILGFKPQAHRRMPGGGAQFLFGGLVGAVGSLVAASGGFLSIPFMVWHNVPMKRAIGTSSGIGVPIAVVGALTYLGSGIGAVGLPSYSVGYVNLPALIGVVSCTMLFAPLGARVASSLETGRLKRVYGIYLLIIAIKMLHSSFA